MINAYFYFPYADFNQVGRRISKNQIIYHTNEHISLLKQIDDELEDKSLLGSDKAIEKYYLDRNKKL